ncbi:hypothetical protein DFH09DRAFT_1304132 [Mycena vulgaris]|nr:hypothetical protein DFH09DRAFT_1304132 [Mycena vulgaris]
MLSQNFEQKREQTARAAFEAAVGEVDKLRDEMKERDEEMNTKRFVLYFVAFAMIYLMTVRKH